MIIVKSNNAMFCFSLESPWDGYSLWPHSLFLFSGALLYSQYFFVPTYFFFRALYSTTKRLLLAPASTYSTKLGCGKSWSFFENPLDRENYSVD
jgi:hypothetical protein